MKSLRSLLLFFALLHGSYSLANEWFPTQSWKRDVGNGVLAMGFYGATLYAYHKAATFWKLFNGDVDENFVDHPSEDMSSSKEWSHESDEDESDESEDEEDEEYVFDNERFQKTLQRCKNRKSSAMPYIASWRLPYLSSSPLIKHLVAYELLGTCFMIGSFYYGIRALKSACSKIIS